MFAAGLLSDTFMAALTDMLEPVLGTWLRITRALVHYLTGTLCPPVALVCGYGDGMPHVHQRSPCTLSPRQTCPDTSANLATISPSDTGTHSNLQVQSCKSANSRLSYIFILSFFT